MNNLQTLMNLLNEYKENKVQVNPKSIINTLKQLDIMYSPYGLKYNNEAAMDIIVFYDNGTRYEITLVNDYIVEIEEETRLADMSEFFMGCEVTFLDVDPNFFGGNK